MVNELAQELDPIEKEEGQEVEQETQEAAQEAEKSEAEGEKGEDGKEGEQTAPEKPPKGFVHQGALHEERARRKELQQEIARIQQAQENQRQLLEQRFAQMQQAWQQQNAPKPPDRNESPIEAMFYEQDRTQQELAQLKAAQQQDYQRRQEEYQRQQYFGKLQSAVTQAEAEFASETPDYLEGVKFLKSQRAAQLEALGMQPHEIIEHVQNEAAQIANSALRNGKNPAEVAYKMAMAAGYKKAQAASDGQQKMETLQKGVKAASSLGSGGTPTGKLTVDAIAQMNDDEFDTFMKSGGWSKLG